LAYVFNLKIRVSLAERATLSRDRRPHRVGSKEIRPGLRDDLPIDSLRGFPLVTIVYL